MTATTRALLNHYLRTCPWVDREDLQQEAALAELEAARQWKDGGAPLDVCQRSATRQRLGRYVWAFRWPVTADRRRFDPAKHDLRKAPIAGLRATADQAPLADALLHSRRAAEMVRQAFALLAIGDVAAEVLLGERKPAEVAAARRVPVQMAYRAVRVARRALREDRHLQEFAEGR
jgi:hypothetical protein